MKNTKCLKARLSVSIIWQKFVLTSGAPESFSTNLMQNINSLTRMLWRARLHSRAFDSELKCWIGTLTREGVHSDANPQLVCNKKIIYSTCIMTARLVRCVKLLLLHPQSSLQLQFVRGLCEVSTSKDADIVSPGLV